MMIMRIIIPTPRLSLPYESQTCPVGCEYAVSTIGVLEVISRLMMNLGITVCRSLWIFRPRVFHLLANVCFFH